MLIKVWINDHLAILPKKLTVLEACITVGARVPKFCYHESLEVAGNCRTCLVEIEKYPKPVVSCTMPLVNEMKIYTKTPLIRKAQENVLEFLLLNHPLHCPICDQGGECDLQDQVINFGNDRSRFTHLKRNVSEKQFGPLIKTVMNRCIHCTRCARFANNIAGIDDFGMIGRGVNAEIGFYFEKVFQSELSSNIVDLCPVGALTLKPSSFVERPWLLNNFYSIDTVDGFGSKIQISCNENQVISKVSPVYDKTINEEWISNKSRFFFDFLNNKKRHIHPSIFYNSIHKKYIDNYKYNSTTKKFKNQFKVVWNDMFYFLNNCFYIQDYLNCFSFSSKNLLIIFNANSNIETILGLKTFVKQYPFFQLRKENPTKLNNDLEINFLLNKNIVQNFDLCLLIGTNPRDEGVSLNLKLRKRRFEGKFVIASLGSSINLSYTINSLGLYFNIMVLLLKGSNFFCKLVKNSENSLFLLGSNLTQRLDFDGIYTVLRNFNFNTNTRKNSFNILNATSNSTGISDLGEFKSLSVYDFTKAFSIYLVESNQSSTIFEKLIELHSLKLLNYFKKYFDNYMIVKNPKALTLFIHENGGFNYFSDIYNNNFSNGLESKLNSLNLHMPTKCVAEKTESFCNVYGIYQKSIKTLKSKGSVKDNKLISKRLCFDLLKNLNLMCKKPYLLNTFSLSHFLNGYQKPIFFNVIPGREKKCLIQKF